MRAERAWSQTSVLLTPPAAPPPFFYLHALDIVLRFTRSSGCALVARVARRGTYFYGANFDTYLKSLLTLWTLMLQNNWHLIHDAALAALGVMHPTRTNFGQIAVSLYFVTFLFLSVWVYLNIFTSHFLSIFDKIARAVRKRQSIATGMDSDWGGAGTHEWKLSTLGATLPARSLRRCCATSAGQPPPNATPPQRWRCSVDGSLYDKESDCPRIIAPWLRDSFDWIAGFEPVRVGVRQLALIAQVFDEEEEDEGAGEYDTYGAHATTTGGEAVDGGGGQGTKGLEAENNHTHATTGPRAVGASGAGEEAENAGGIIINALPFNAFIAVAVPAIPAAAAVSASARAAVASPKKKRRPSLSTPVGATEYGALYDDGDIGEAKVAIDKAAGQAAAGV